MTTQSIQAPKTTVNRFLLFLLIGFTTAVPILIFGLFVFSWINLLCMPLVIFVFLIIMVAKEKRVSSVKPGWLEYLLSFLGAFYPPVLVTILLWLVWWGFLGIGTLFSGDPFGIAYEFAGIVYGLLSLGAAIFLVRLNWRHVANQLYPYRGSQSAFAKITESGKMWLVKRGILLTIIFFVLLVVYFLISGALLSEDGLTVLDEFLLGGFFILVYLLFLSVSAWFWLRQPDIHLSLSETNETLANMLKAAGYKVRMMAELKSASGSEVEISDFMTASVDLVAGNENGSLVIDVMTLEETTEAPDWVKASEFRSATWYLQRVLQLPAPVEAVFVLVDVIPDDSLLTFADNHDIKLVQLSNEKVAEWFTGSDSETVWEIEATALFHHFSSLVTTNTKNETSLTEQVLASGGKNG